MGFLLSIIIVTFGLASCSEGIANNKEIDELSKNIGEKKEKLLENLKLEEGKDIEKYEEMPGVYVYKEERTFHDESFQLGINFDVENDKMYGFTYFKNFADDGKDGYEVTKELYKDLNKEFGEPTTYPLLSHKITEMPDYEELPAKEYSEYMETWETNNGLEAELRMYNNLDNGILVTLVYKMMNEPENSGD